MFGNVLHDRLKRIRYFLVRKPGLSRLYDLLLSAKNQTIGGFVRVDACTMCQLHCPECPTGRGENRHGVIGWNFLRYENFVKFIQQNPFVNPFL